MKPRKTTLLVALVALILAAFAIGMAQGTTQTDQKKKDSCCAEGAKCAEGAESCKEGESCCKEGAECCKEGAECCKKAESCCSGESCEMHHATGDAAKGDAKAKHKHGEGDCCKMKQKEKVKTKKTN